MTTSKATTGPLALVGGGEFSSACADIDRELIGAVDADEVLVLATAAAFENATAVEERAAAYFSGLGVKAEALPVLHRHDADGDDLIAKVRSARAICITDGSPMHLRSVLKDSELYGAIVHAHRRGAVVIASGAGATLLGDPMVDPRGGAYTVGLGLVPGLAVFPYHGTTAEHLRVRSVDLLPKDAVLCGIDAETAVVRRADAWTVEGAGSAVVYRKGSEPETVTAGNPITLV